MDPSSLDSIGMILAALAAGASEGVTSAAKDAVEGTVSGVRRIAENLRQRVHDRFKGDKVAEASLVMFDSDPEQQAFVVALGRQLEKYRVDLDREILSLADAIVRSDKTPSISADVLTIWADRGSVATGINHGTITIHNEQGKSQTPGEK